MGFRNLWSFPLSGIYGIYLSPSMMTVLQLAIGPHGNRQGTGVSGLSK